MKGLSELNTFLTAFEPKLSRNIMSGALRAGVKEILPTAKANIHSVSGQLARGLKIGTRVQKGVIKGYIKATGKHAFIHRFVEFGTRAHFIPAKKGSVLFFGGIFTKGVDHPGAKPKPFARPALDAKATAAVIAAGNYIKDRLASKHGIDVSHVTVEGDE